MPHVFISYTKKNRSIADQICSLLERNGLRCWIAPRDIPPGYPWPETIMAAVGQSEVLISVVSADAYLSAHMARELQGADVSGVPVLPIRLDDAPLQGPFQYFLGNSQWLDLQGRTPDQCESDVATAVRRLRARSATNVDGVGDGPAPPHGSSDTGTHAAALGRDGPILRQIADELKEVIATFVSVALKREKALVPFDLGSPRTLFFAFRFLVYMSLISASLHIPAWSAQGIRFSHPAFMSSVLLEAVIEQVALCFLLYLVTRTFGVQADPQQFVCAFCLLSAYQVMSDICLVPVQVRAIAVQSPDVEQFVRGILDMGDHAPLGDLLVLLIAGLTSMGFRIVFVLGLFSAFHVTEQIGARKATMSLVLAIGLWLASVMVFSQKFLANLYSAYRGG